MHEIGQTLFLRCSPDWVVGGLCARPPSRDVDVDGRPDEPAGAPALPDPLEGLDGPGEEEPSALLRALPAAACADVPFRGRALEELGVLVAAAVVRSVASCSGIF